MAKRPHHTIFKESGIKFYFNENWNIYQYDRHRFYSGLSGFGLKGVDFIGILNKNSLVLIEVKNYVDRFIEDGVDPTEEFMKAYDTYLQAYAEKFRDTLKGIQTVQKYYRRKWWYRNLLKPFSKIIALKHLLAYDWAFWTKTHQLAFLENKKIQLVLWLSLDQEIAKQHDFQINDFQKKLEQLLKEELSRNNWEIIIASETANPFFENLQTD